MKIVKFCAQFCLLLCVSFLIACGGGSDSAGNPDPTPPPPVTVTPPVDVTISEQAASKFLGMSSFGARLEDIQSLSDMGYEAWLDDQFSMPVTTHLSYLQALPEIEWRDHISAWLSRSATADDQLRQRVAFALSEIWVVSLLGVDFPSGDIAFPALANYYDILLEHSFGNYRDLMSAVTLSPVMCEYLSMKGNEKANPQRNILPDENYAREMMQLFSIGLHELNLDGTQKLDTQGLAIPTYNQTTIEEMARVFTGWDFSNRNNPFDASGNYAPDYMGAMVAYSEKHDTEPKTVLGNTILPAGQTAEQDLDDMLDVVFNHPNVGPFISKQLIQKLVTSNPSNAYIERVATVFNNNGSDVRGDMQSVVRAILLDDEAITGTTSEDKEFGKLKEPVVTMAGLWRTFDAQAANGQYRLTWFREFLGQAPLESFSVFNFFSPFYSPQGEFLERGLVAPEFQIHSEANMAKMTNFIQFLVIGLNNKNNTSPEADEVLINLDRETELATDIDALLDHYNLLLFSGDMSDELRAITKTYAETISDDRPDRRAWETLSILVVSPEFMIQD